jgi:hypothetical protein
MVANGLDYEQVDSEERSMLKEELMGLCGVVNEGMLVATNYYKWVSEKQTNRRKEYKWQGSKGTGQNRRVSITFNQCS